MKKTVTIIIPAFNEEKNIAGAVRGALTAVRGTVSDYEILVIDDGSTDKTVYEAEKLAKRNKKIKLIKHARNLGFGLTIKEGIKKARQEYVVGFPGDNDTSAVSLRNIIIKAGRKDLIISYTRNSGTRSVARRLFSKSFVVLMNLIFGLKLRYFNGSFICKTRLLQNENLTSEGFAIYAEAKVRLLKKGYSYMEIPFTHTGRKHGQSKAVSWKSVGHTFVTVYHLIKDIHFARKDALSF